MLINEVIYDNYSPYKLDYNIQVYKQYTNDNWGKFYLFSNGLDISGNFYDNDVAICKIVSPTIFDYYVTLPKREYIFNPDLINNDKSRLYKYRKWDKETAIININKINKNINNPYVQELIKRCIAVIEET